VVTINKINLKQNDEIQKEFTKNIGMVLQKIGSSHKTKALHNLMEKGMLYIGYGTSDISRNRAAEFGIQYLTGNKLSGLTADISSVVDKADLNEVAKKVRDISAANKELTRIKTTVTDTSAMQMKNLDKEIKKLFKEILDAIDYFDLVDVYYYLYINTLAIIGLKGNGKNKIFEVTYEIFTIYVNKILVSTHNIVAPQDRLKLAIILEYVFTRTFTEQSAQSTIGQLSKMYSQENVQFLKDLKPNDYTEFKDIAILLTKAELVNITQNSFLGEFHKLIGEGAKRSMEGTFDELVAYIISSNYKSNKFDSRKIAEKEQERLEQLILNYKKDLIIKA
jgi:hypothetical protein